ncbi:extracellular solute-binding protein [Cohnella abietis]|uniref:ABC transporter substrate-binding protein n=1 Tax=Cohnella abietis TaxID=2507935 RepID=A0A3T1D9H7_9BACL|nr:extracellular solute-binding protein [Cohnella abietis]BBI34695.1 hypothetical protein KCTCHS21_40940 [Cohnella abietis]
MARRKSALVFVLLCITALVISPWADAPSPKYTPSPESPVAPVTKGEPFASEEPAVAEEISHITVGVALGEQEFNALADQNKQFLLNNKDMTVDLLRIDPEQSYSIYRKSSQMEESADVMLLSNEWVKEFAVSGYLLPADSAFVGKALAEQFDALLAPLKWNDYLWGVPHDMDPFVIAWNTDVLHKWLGEDVTLPLTLEQWVTLSARSAEQEGAISWLTIDPNDPLALLAWLENATGERSDEWWSDESSPLDNIAVKQALSLIEQQRAGVSFTSNAGEAARLLNDGTTLAAIVPYSLAATWEAEPWLVNEAKIEIDHQAWKLPFVWPRGNSFVISANTKEEEAAYKWIAEMTSDQIQLHNMEKQRKLPVYRSIYDSDSKLSNLLPGRAGKSFPNQSPLYMGPDMADQLNVLGNLWRRLAKGNLTLENWKEEWHS